ncbi:hypothetical protein ACF044_10885 [Microbacterium sp. NPDC016588]
MGETRVCMFCGESRKLTGAHIIARNAIRRHLPKLHGPHDRYDTWIGTDGEHSSTVKRINIDGLDQQVKRACVRCNGAWMGGIENEIGAHVVNLALGNELTLSAHEAGRIAVWAGVVSMLRASQDPGISAVDPADPRWMHATSQLPPGYVVRLVHGELLWDFATRHQRFTVPTADGGLVLSHSTMFWIGHAVFLVNHPAMEGIVSRVDRFGDAVFNLSTEGLTWAPRRQVPRSSVVEMTDSFGRIPRGYVATT